MRHALWILLLYPWLAAPPSDTIARRIQPPAGYTRIQQDSETFAEWLAGLPVKSGRPPVYLYNGQKKSNQDAHYVVLDIDVGGKNLQQCADAVIRLRAEYLWASKQYSDIQFHFTSGDLARLTQWHDGFRPVINGNHVRWVQSAAQDSSYGNFRKYLDTIFTYSGSYSLSKELRKMDVALMQPGDVFLQGGFPGHAVIVVAMAVHERTGKKLFLLAQSYMPAQEIHILKNPNDPDLSPWYELDFGNTLVTPEWDFTKNDLRRW
jgi:hypothetical protein